MHAILTAIGSYGDVHPVVGLGRALLGRGHRVAVVTNPHFEGLVREAGLDFVPVSTAERYDRLTRHPGLWKPRQGLSVALQEGGLSLLRELHTIVAERAIPGDTVLAIHGLDLASRVVAESKRIPAVSLVYAPLALWSNRSPPRFPVGISGPWVPRWFSRLQFRLGQSLLSRQVSGPLESLRGELGLPRIARGLLDWYYGVAPPVCLFPDWFCSPQEDWPADAVTTQFPLWDGGQVDPLSAEAEGFLDAGEPPIVFTPGSANRQAEPFFAAATEACQRIERRGILLSKYPEQLPERLPDSVRHFAFEPLSRLLSRSAGFVHHGGIGSSAQGLASGVPQLIQPMGFDQFDNAMRLQQLGVADELGVRQFQGPAVAKKLDTLLTTASVAEATERCAVRFVGVDSLEEACLQIERHFQKNQR